MTLAGGEATSEGRGGADSSPPVTVSVRVCQLLLSSKFCGGEGGRDRSSVRRMAGDHIIVHYSINNIIDYYYVTIILLLIAECMLD